MNVRADASLARLTTLRLGGPARRLVRAGTEEELLEAVRAGDPEGGPVLLLAGGSNLVVADDGFDGTVIHVDTTGIDIRDAHGTPDVVHATVAAGEPWDAFVGSCVEADLTGIECLSGIPGSTGATPIQNVGAYGQEVAETIVAVRAYDRDADTVVELAPPDCSFGYRTSAFKGHDRFVVVSVTFALRRNTGGGVVRYAELAGALGVQPGERAPLAALRETVLRLRAGKGMVLDADDHDTWSAGSFFTNPLLGADAFAALEIRARELVGADARVPSWPQADGAVKTSAAWLIERAGFTKGFAGSPTLGGRVALSGKHTLALTNRGEATTADLLALAREIRDGVHAAFGVVLVPEPVFVGVTL